MISTPRRRLAAYVLVVVAMVWGLWRVQSTTDELHDLVRAEAHEDEREQAEACVNQHGRYHEFIPAIERLAVVVSGVGAQVGTDAHLDLLESTEAERHAAHSFIDRRLSPTLEPELERFLADYPPPSCDLEAAQRRLADQ